MDSFEKILTSTVLQDTLDKLTILGHINQTCNTRTNKKTTNKSSTFNKSSIGNGDASLLDPNDSFKNNSINLSQNANNIIHSMASAAATSNYDNPANSQVKLERDRQFLEEIILGALNEIHGSGTYEWLIEKVNSEKHKKCHHTSIIENEMRTRKQIKQMQSNLIQLKKDQEVEVMNRQQLIAHLKDQLQEFKAKTNLECKYVKKSTENDLAQNLAKCSLDELTLKAEKDTTLTLIDEEDTSHKEMVKFLGVNHEQLIDDLEAWNNKCDSEIEKKELDLKNLKKEKENKQGDFEELKLNFASYKAVVVEDRTEKERIKREKEELERQVKACVQMQAWWRGTMVRKGFGEFKKGGKKGKKGKGGKKGKKGKK